ncbi:MAG: YhcH/YjgK/YiaL family protein [Bacteroidaceae bacterium]|nr:YhcH/YjgK/YiaL family protein [Bacteroidaceae bacterium]
MVLDILENIGKYVQLHPLIKEVADFLEKNELRSLDFGRIYIKGDELFANIDNQSSKSKEDAVLETHSKYIDIQIPISSDEIMGFTAANMLPQPHIPYDAERDIAFYPGVSDIYINVRKGMFVIFFPEEGHAPAISENGLKKIVFKIKV